MLRLSSNCGVVTHRAVRGVLMNGMLVVGKQIAPEHAVVRIEIVIDASGNRWASNCRGRIPQESGSVQAVAVGEVIRQGLAINYCAGDAVKRMDTDAIHSVGR